MPCKLTLNELLTATGGRALSDRANSFEGVSTDSRQKAAGTLFIPLKGDHFDGHDFLSQAVDQGSAIVLVDRETEDLHDLQQKVTVVRVNDTLKAMQGLAKFWRTQLSGKVVGITGSNGKSTTKDFATQILSRKFSVSSSKKSFNNHIGVPLSILAASKDDQVVILEMGMNHAGELEQLSKIARPDIVLCTMVGRAHIGNFGGTPEAIANAKEEIYLTNPEALMIFNYDNEHTLRMYERVSKLKGTDRVMVFSSFAAGAEVSLRATHLELDGLQVTGHVGGVKGEARVPAFGRQNVVALMAAASIAFALGMEPEDIWRQFGECHSGWGRNQLVRLESDILVLFDAYNANPDSMSILLKNIFEINVPGNGRKVAVLGEMLELGDTAEKAHVEMGELAGNVGLDFVCFVGPSWKHFEAGLKNVGYSKNFIVSPTYEDYLASKVRDVLKPGDVVVMKASRGVRLERMLKTWHPGFMT